MPIGKVGAASLYIFTLSVGYICLLMGGVWMSRLLKNNLMDDVFNTENESFMAVFAVYPQSGGMIRVILLGRINTGGTFPADTFNLADGIAATAANGNIPDMAFIAQALKGAATDT